MSAVGNISDHSLRKKLQRLADFSRGGPNDLGVWTLKPDVKLREADETREMVTPEQVVLFECMLAGHQRLSDAGLKRSFLINLFVFMDGTRTDAFIGPQIPRYHTSAPFRLLIPPASQSRRQI